MWRRSRHAALTSSCPWLGLRNKEAKFRGCFTALNFPALPMAAKQLNPSAARQSVAHQAKDGPEPLEGCCGVCSRHSRFSPIPLGTWHWAAGLARRSCAEPASLRGCSCSSPHCAVFPCGAGHLIASPSASLVVAEPVMLAGKATISTYHKAACQVNESLSH